MCFPGLSLLLSPHYTLFSFHGTGSFHGLIPQPRELPRACETLASHWGLPSPSLPPLFLLPGALVQLPKSETGERDVASFLLPTSRSPPNPLTVESYQYFSPNCCEYLMLFLDGRVCPPSRGSTSLKTLHFKMLPPVTNVPE